MQNTSTISVLKSLQELYANKKYKEGIDLLIENRSQFEEAQFHYNLGTFYAKSGELAAARYNLEKSILNGAVGTEVYHNLRNVKKQLNVQDISNSPFLSDQIVNYSLAAPGGLFITLSLVILLSTLIAYRTKFLKNLYLFGFLIFLSLVPISFDSLYISNLTYGVALDRVNVYEGPSEIFDSLKTLDPGSKVVIGKIRSGWFFISSPVDASGWIKKDSLALY